MTRRSGKIRNILCGTRFLINSTNIYIQQELFFVSMYSFSVQQETYLVSMSLLLGDILFFATA